MEVLGGEQLRDRSVFTYGRHMEHSHFRVDVQGTPAPQKMVRTPKTDKALTTTTLE